MDFFKDKKILITGGTGTFGQALTERLLKLDVHSIRIFSRNEDKQVSMQEKFNDKRIRFFVGDIRDFSRLKISDFSTIRFSVEVFACPD